MTHAKPPSTLAKPPLTQAKPAAGVLGVALAAAMLAACQPSVQVKAPDKPITINLNVKLDAEVRVKLEEKAEQDIEKNPDIF